MQKAMCAKHVVLYAVNESADNPVKKRSSLVVRVLLPITIGL